MALINNDLVQVTFRGLCFNQRIILTANYVVVGDAPVLNSIFQDLTRVCAAVGAGGVGDIETSYLACLPAQYSLESIRAQRIKATRSAFFDVLTPGVVGTHASPATVANDSSSLHFSTFIAGRSHISVKHIGPAPDAASANGLLTAPYKVLLDALGTRMIGQFIPATLGCTLAPVVANLQTGVFDVFQGYRIGSQSRVMRRRTVGLGE